MRRRQSSPPYSFFRGNEFMRLMTMIFMLAVLFMLIHRSGEPNTWTWLADNKPASQIQNSPESSVEKEQEPSEKPTDANDPKVSTPAPGGPTDQEPEEVDAIKEEFQAVSDGSISIQREEMPAYNRLLQWVQNQSLAEMKKRAQKNFVFTQFYQTPDKYRGQLFELELNVRRILEYPHNDMTLYEVWGWTSESRSWPYVGVVIDLPQGMPIGPEVYETATLVGYFFKLEGYMEAGAKPRDKPLQAPLFVGRLIWHPAVKPQVQSSDWYWGLFLLVGFLLFIIIRWGLLLWKPRRGSLTSTTVITKPGAGVEDWLAKADANELTEENASDDSG
ncbi:MAG TPA: hypothetical protein VIH42_04870 [Thermoguttaceae bacterium]